MAKNEAKIKFSAEVGEFNSAIKKANDEISNLRAEMKLNDAQMKNSGESIEGLEKKHQLLSNQLKVSEDKTEALRKKLEKAVEIFGENSEEASRLQRQLLNAQTAEENVRKAVSNCNDALEKQRDAERQAESATEQLNKKIQEQESELADLKGEYTEVVLQYGKTSKEAKDLGKKIGTLSNDLAENKTKMSNAEKAADKFDKSLDDVESGAKDASDGLGVLDVAMGNLVATGISSLISGIGEAASSLMNLADETREYREDIGKLETAWEAAGKSTSDATETYKEFYSVLGEEDRSVEAVNHLAKFVDTEKDMSRWTDICAGVWGTFGDSLPIEGLTEASNETAKTGKLTGVLADALNWAGVNEEDFQSSLDSCNSERERASLITETLNDLYKDAAKKYKDNNKSIIESRKATSDYTDTMADLGETMEPVNTKLTELKNGFAKEFAPVLEDSIIPAIEDFIDTLDDTGALQDISRMIGDLARTLLPPLASIIGFVAENWKVLAIGIGSVVVAMKTMSIVNTVTTALQGTTGAMAGLNAVMAANPIGAVITALAALVGVCGLLIDSYKNAKDNLDYVSEALDANTEANLRWQETMDSARVEMGEYSNFANAAGETTSSLRGKVEEAQTKITEIYATAFEQNRGLRDEEIADIKKYNEEYIEAQNQLVELEQQKLKAQVDSLQWRLDNMDLSAEEEQAILNTLSDLRVQHSEVLGETVANELVWLDQRLQNEQISKDEYNTLREEALAKQKGYAEEEKNITEGLVQDTLNAQAKRFEIDTQAYTDRTHHFKSMEHIHKYYAEQAERISNDETLSWWDKFTAKEKLFAEWRGVAMDFAKGEEATWTDYNFLTDRKIQENQQSFFNWIANNKANGVELSEDSKENAKMILDAYASLPEDLQDSGLESLRGLAKGMEDEYPELADAAEMDMEELIQTMNDALGVHSPSWKMEDAGENVMSGLRGGMNSKFGIVTKLASTIGNSLISRFKSAVSGITGAFKGVDGKISNPFKTARSVIKTQVDRIKGFFTGLKLKLPKIKLPHFKLSGSFSLSPPSVPKLSVDWYAKGGIMTKPTIFGMNGNRLMGGGEAGAEAILPISKLEDYVTNAVQKTISSINIEALVSKLEDLANRPIAVNVNGREVAVAMASDSDSVNGMRSSYKSRGLEID